MNKDQELLVRASELIFEGNEVLLTGDCEKAEQVYDRLTEVYKKVPSSYKPLIYKHAVKLQSRISGHKKKIYTASNTDKYFKRYNGKVIKDLYHLAYTLDGMQTSEFQAYVNAMRNDLHEWIKYTLKEDELSFLLKGITDLEAFKSIVMRYLLLRQL